MKRVYDFFRKFYWLFILGVILNVAFGLVAFGMDYENEQFVIPRVGSTLFLIFLISSLGFAIFFAYKAKNLHITKVRNQASNFLKLASWLSCAIAIFFFVFESIKFIFTKYIDGASAITFPRVARYILTLPLAAYFFLEAFPTKIKKKKIVIPRFLNYILSVCTIIWGIMSILAVYKYEKLSSTNMLKNWQIIFYLVLTLFFLFEAKFKHVNQKGFCYVLSAASLFILAVSFSITVILSLSFGFIPLDHSESFTEVEYVLGFLFGLYAFARLHAMQKTMKHIMDNDDKGSFSSKFNKKPNDFATDSAEQEKLNEK
jgi:hypothetical protein